MGGVFYNQTLKEAMPPHPAGPLCPAFSFHDKGGQYFYGRRKESNRPRGTGSPAGPGGSKAPPVPQAEQQPVQLGIKNLDFPTASRTLAQQTEAKETACAVKITVEFYSRLAYTME